MLVRANKLRAMPSKNKILEDSTKLLPEKIFINKSGKKKKAVKAIIIQIDKKIMAFSIIFLDFFLSLPFSADSGNIALLIGAVPQKIVFARMDAIAYIPASCSLNIIFAITMSMLKNNVIINVIKKTGAE